MDFFSTVVVVGLTLAAIGLLVLGLAATKGAVLLGMREDAPWWFSPRGGRTQGFAVAYLGLLVALALGPPGWLCTRISPVLRRSRGR